ncbi:MAG: ROK family protein [Myxococcota bacterium]
MNSSSPDTPITLALDIGGSALKAALLDAHGHLLGECVRVSTPRPAVPQSILRTLQDQAGMMPLPFDRVSAGFPGVVRAGIVATAPNLDPAWHGVNLHQELQDRLNKPARAANDADVQGLGCIRGQGVELVLTLGTGMGSALFCHGRLVPNLELGHHPFADGHTYEELLGKQARHAHGHVAWQQNLLRALALLQRIFNPDTLYLGGGHAAEIDCPLPPRVLTVANVNGLLGGVRLWTAT